ncbi:hypothetical protein [Actinokineospora enzanensis]|uniref:hypothetical protein n=1 Tax=Actinokineospora enzanensis TaxID=155975 RepID=UPI0003781AB2|nr:hypothetical protein [Actinokineospora enzanensis]
MDSDTDYDAAIVEIVELSAAEAAEAFDALARRAMGLSGAEFLARWDSGEWADRDLDEVPGLVDVWMSLPMLR